VRERAPRRGRGAASELTRRNAVLGGLLVLVLATGLYLWLRDASPPPPRASTPPAGEELPLIDLARLQADRPVPRVGRRDLFEFGAPPTPPPTPRPVFTATPEALGSSPPTPLPSPRLPPLSLRYIGSLENARGLRVAVLLTDRNEVLTGQAGEILANRYRIARIGYESVDLEEVGTGQVRRLPLRGN
jgi:hypothetical protein